MLFKFLTFHNEGVEIDDNDQVKETVAKSESTHRREAIDVEKEESEEEGEETREFGQLLQQVILRRFAGVANTSLKKGAKLEAG